MEEVKTFGDMDVASFGVSHDAVAPMFYTFHHQGKKVALVTDLGYVSDRIKKTVEGADAYIFEANHDVGMLRMGKYPWNVKRRILGEITGFITVISDVTEQEKVEAERREFVSNVSHELRTPLTTMKSYVEALGIGPAYMDKAARCGIRIAATITVVAKILLITRL